MDNTKCIAALFDFDGVVMDTETQYSLFWNKIGKQYFPQIEEFGRIIRDRRLLIFMRSILRVWRKNSKILQHV